MSVLLTAVQDELARTLIAKKKLENENKELRLRLEVAATSAKPQNPDSLVE